MRINLKNVHYMEKSVRNNNMEIEIPIFKEFIECNIAGSFLVNPYWLEHLLNLFYQGYIVEVQEEIWNTQHNDCKTIENSAYGIIGSNFRKEHLELNTSPKA